MSTIHKPPALELQDFIIRNSTLYNIIISDSDPLKFADIGELSMDRLHVQMVSTLLSTILMGE